MAKQRVVITNQSFRDAGGLETFPDLEIQDMIVCKAIGEEHGGRISAISAGIAQLRSTALEQGCSHVFKVEYETIPNPNYHHSYHIFDCEIKGTPYKPKQ
ncbi:MAG: hypothetical protein WC548_04440 [Candidatus Pacearchaeota archaeon]